MKQFIKTTFLLLAFLLPALASAHDFEVDGIYYNINGNKATVTFKGSYSNSYSDEYSGSVVIPPTVTYNGTTYSVTSIGGAAFAGCTGLTSIVIPNSVTSIGGSAFYYCSGLTSITIPNSVTSIGYYAFRGCSGLTSISVPNSVTSIGDYAFEACSGLTSITIPNSVTSIGYYAFEGCSGLTSIVVESGNPSYDSRNNCNAIIETANNTLIAGCKNTVIPNSVTSIGGYAFAGCTGLTSIVIGNSVTSIGDFAFRGCSGLTSITIPNSVTSIGGHAFYGCSGLTSITIPNSVTSIGDYAFEGCSGLTSITIPNSVTSIGGHAFFGCSGLTSIVIPNSVISIGDDAFYGCSGLTSITIPNSVTSIGDGAFRGCSGLTSITIPNSVTSIGDEAFRDCTGLTSITIPNSVTCIGYDAFWNTAWYKNQPDGLVYAGKVAYKYKGSMPTGTSITIKEGTLGIAGNAFSGYTGLSSITIPNSVTSIGGGAFRGCSGLTSISIPNSVTSIGGDAFWNTAWYKNQPDGLVYAGKVAYKYKGSMPTGTSITIKEGTLGIADYAFDGCSGLTSITIPNSVTCIGIYAFIGCSGLTSITIPNSVTSIGGYAFYECTGLTSIAIGNSVTSISDGAFIGCTGLTSITIPNSVTSIGDRAFDGCSGLTSITIPNSVTSISDGAFIGCSGLTSITIPNSVTSIGDEAFRDCIGLTSITIGNSVTSIGDYAFSYCSGLNQVLSYITDLSSITMGSYVFYRDPANYGDRTLYVPHGTAADYQADSKWSRYFGSIVEIEGFLSMSDTAACRRDIVRIPVKMSNTASIISFQTDIFLPEGLELVQEDGEYLIEPSARMTPSHVIMSNDVSNGAIRVLCYSSSYKPFVGNSGDDLFYLTVKVADDAEGDYTIQLKNTLLTKSDFVDVAAPDVAAHVNVNGYLLGDANMSGAITVTDVVVTAQYILERNPSPFEFEAADVNRDNNITVADVSRIAWMILNTPLNALRRAPAVWNSGDRMGAEGITLAAGETRRVSIQLDNEADYNAFQLDLQLPDGLTASNLCLTDRAGSHTLDVGTLKDGKIRALCYSPSLAVIKGRSGALLTLDVTAAADVTGDITVDGIELVSADCQSVKLDAFAIGVNHTTALNEPAAVKKTVATVAYYNLAGQRMTRPSTGVTLVVTTYTDGSQTTSKVIY